MESDRRRDQGIMRFCSIASGSSGNCIYIGSEQTHMLVDIGISGKKMEAGLNSIDLTGRDLHLLLFIPLPETILMSATIANEITTITTTQKPATS